MVGLVHHEGSRVIVMHVAIVVGWVAVWVFTFQPTEQVEHEFE